MGSPFHCEAIDTGNVIIRGIDEGLILRNIATINSMFFIHFQ